MGNKSQNFQSAWRCSIGYLLSDIRKTTEAKVQYTPLYSALGICCGYMWMQTSFPGWFLAGFAGMTECAHILSACILV